MQTILVADPFLDDVIVLEFFSHITGSLCLSAPMAYAYMRGAVHTNSLHITWNEINTGHVFDAGDIDAQTCMKFLTRGAQTRPHFKVRVVLANNRKRVDRQLP